jgi:sugar phosphate isomerase/epimerase
MKLGIAGLLPGKDREMALKLGVAGLLPTWEKIDLAAAQRIRQAGFCGASIFFDRPLKAEPAAVRRLKETLEIAGVDAAQANGWYECLVNPDEALRQAGIQGIQALVRLGRQLATPSVYVRPGSLNPRGHWYPHPENHTPRTFDRLVDSLRQACAVAQAEGMLLVVEGHVLSPLDSAQRIRDLLDAVGSPALKFNIDPVNFIGCVADVYDTRGVLNELFDLLGQDIAAAHLKDLALEDELVLHIAEVTPGSGTLDYDLFLTRLQQTCPDVYCLIEHLPDDQVPQARQAVCATAERLGIHLEHP